jgi:hypothetical protein
LRGVIENYITFTILKKGSITAIIIVQTIAHTAIITIGSIAVARFFTILSISLLNFIEILLSKFGILPVCSHIFTTEESSIGK